MDEGQEDVARRVKEITGGEMAYGATDAVTGDMTGQFLIASKHYCLQLLLTQYPLAGIASYCTRCPLTGADL